MSTDVSAVSSPIPPPGARRLASADALSRLAAVLDPRGFITVLTTGHYRPPRLTVTTRQTDITADIYAEGDWYRWGWAECIAPTADPRTATATITRSLLGAAATDA